jgi:hypothetical protein
MIVTLTPNPSLDRTLEVAALHRGEVLRATTVRVDAGGKGINVARALRPTATTSARSCPWVATRATTSSTPSRPCRSRWSPSRSPRSSAPTSAWSSPTGP